jgi:hypothetical protein
MMSFPSFRCIGISFLIPIALAACGGAAASPSTTPLATQITIVTATASVQATPPPDTPTAQTSSLPLEIVAAFKKTRAVKNVRYEITSEVSFVQNGATVRQPGLNARGAESGDNRHLAISGILNATGEVATFEFITLEGATYIKGLRGIPGVNPAQWYKFPKELGNVTRDAPSVKTLLAEFELQDLKQGTFVAGGSETVDGSACTVWTAHDPKLAQGFIGIANSHEAANQLQALDKGEFRVWTCADGYIHRITGSVQGHDPSNTQNQANVQMTFHLYDHDATIDISAPPDAQDFQVPVQGADETPTP